MSEKRKIPTAEELARASRMMRERLKGLGEVESAIAEHFRSIASIHKVFVLPQSDVNFRVYVFLERTSDIVDCDRNGILQAIRDFVPEAIERVGRGNVGATTFAFEFDSHENVMSECDGSYFHRLR